jgi:hypothetical protein
MLLAQVAQHRAERAGVERLAPVALPVDLLLV